MLEFPLAVRPVEKKRKKRKMRKEGKGEDAFIVAVSPTGFSLRL